VSIDSNTFGLLLIGVALSLFALWMVSRRRPERRRFALAAIAGLAAMLVGLLVFFLSPFFGGGPLLD